MQTRQDTFLAFDLGASGGRAVAGLLQDHHLKLTEVNRFNNAPLGLGGTLYWDFLALWSNVLQSLSLCARKGLPAMSAIGLDSWGVDWGLLGRDGKLLANPVCYRDRITEGVERIIEAKVGQERLYQITGQRLTRVSTLAQLVGYNRSDSRLNLKSARSLLMISDLFRYFLCGHEAVELTAAGSTQLIDVKTSKWSTSLANLLRLPASILPKLAKPATTAGMLRDEIRSQTGLTSTPVVTVAGHDTASAAAAVPFIDEDCVFASCGTWSVVGVVQDHATTTADSLRCGFINELGVDSMLLVRNLAGMYLLENLRRSMRAAGETLTYAGMTRMAGQEPAFKYLIDLNSPSFFVAGNVTSQVKEHLRLTGQPSRASWPAVVRAILESLAMEYRLTIANLRRITGREFRRLCLVGGGSRNHLFCQMVADATGLEVIAGPAEATCAGNIGLQALAVGAVRDSGEIRRLVRESFHLPGYKPGSSSLWHRQCDRYNRIVEKSK